ncbi:MAG TPA: GNAT family N-acetyltransferase [Nitrospiria bacterium]|nr:GNAT family N-acetyltransferase [Nitrospiria bacterium]
MDKIIVSIAHTQEDFFRLIRLREEVFVLEQKVPLEVELDDEDDRATHLIAREGREVVGTARLVVKGTAGKVGRMAVKREWRKKGVGERLMETLIPLARERGVSSLVLHAQTSAVPFYKKQGFRTEGEKFIEAGIQHIAMRREV